eukprot:scaffold3917_cov113-Isochrysis_galbana.AAC.7
MLIVASKGGSSPIKNRREVRYVRIHAPTYLSVVGGLLRGRVWRALGRGRVGVFVEAILAVDAIKKLVRLKKPRLPSALGLSGACGVEA